MAKPVIFAFDRSVRTFDIDGRLHIAAGNPISKAMVSEYYGREIPGWESLGLTPDRLYKLLRDPVELAKAADSFNNLQVLLQHIPVNANEPMREITVGSTGTDAAFNDPYLTNSLVVWDQEAIDLIESNEQKELSAAYRYTPKMTPGTHDGVRYDGIMTEIIGNHIALVQNGRAGRDVVVGDAQIIKVNGMLNSRKALMVAGALSAAIRPMLAQDAALDVESILGDVTRSNWQSKKAMVAIRVTNALKGKLAQDADLESVIGLLDKLDQIDDGAEADELPPAVDADGDATSQVMAFLAGKLSDDDIKQVAGLLGAGALDSDDDDKDDDNKKDVFDKGAMDAAIQKARQEERAISVACEEVKPLIGALALDAAINTAADVYKLALDAANVDVKGVDPSAFRSMVRLVIQSNATPKPKSIALDSDVANGVKSKFGDAMNRLIIS